MKKIKSVVPVGKIKTNLRRIHTHCPERAKAKERAKVDAALYKCEFCGVLAYEGDSDKNYHKMVDKYPNSKVIKGKLQLDHKDPVVDVKTGFVDWNDYINSLWILAEEYNVICEECHKSKSAGEMSQRALHGSLKKKS